MKFAVRTVKVFVVLASLGLANIGAVSVEAQDTAIYIDLPDMDAAVGDTLRIPVSIASWTDPIAGFSLLFALDRPGLVEFDGTPLLDESGTLIEAWEETGGYTPSATSIRVSGIADFNSNGDPPPIPPLTLGETLLYLMARIPCDPDTISGTIVELVPTGLAEFSDPDGNLIQPVSATGGTIHIYAAQLGDLDHSGSFDVIDVVGMVNCAFRGSCPPCGTDPADLDCSGSVDIIDVVIMIGHVFRGEPQPACP